MFRKDIIFWTAVSISILGIVLTEITTSQVWLLSIACAYLLRPTLASLNIDRKHVDERQMSIQYRSGNIAFAIMMIGCIAFSAYEDSRNDHSWEFFNAVVILGVAAKAVSNVILIGNYRAAARKIVISVGLIMVLFATLENGLSLGALMESLPGLTIIGVGLLSIMYPRTIGGIILAITVALLVLIFSKGFIIGQIITSVLITVPLILAGISLIVGDKTMPEFEGNN
jgi:hypothetical protein